MSAWLRRTASQARCTFSPEGAAVGVLRRRVRVLFQQVKNTGDRAAVGIVPAGYVPDCFAQTVEEFTLPVGRPVAGLTYAHVAEIERANRCLPLEN